MSEQQDIEIEYRRYDRFVELRKCNFSLGLINRMLKEEGFPPTMGQTKTDY